MVRCVLDFLCSPHSGLLALLHTPHGRVLDLLRASLHRLCGVFDALFERIGHLLHGFAPCRVRFLSGAYAPRRVELVAAPAHMPREGAVREQAPEGLIRLVPFDSSKNDAMRLPLRRSTRSHKYLGGWAK